MKYTKGEYPKIEVTEYTDRIVYKILVHIKRPVDHTKK